MWVIGTAIVREGIDAQVWTTLSNNYSPSHHLWNYWHNIHTVESRKSCDEMRWSYLMLYYPQGFHYLVCAVDSNWQHWDREASSIIQPWSAAPLRCMHSVSSSRTLSRWHVHHRIDTGGQGNMLHRHQSHNRPLLWCSVGWDDFGRHGKWAILTGLVLGEYSSSDGQTSTQVVRLWV